MATLNLDFSTLAVVAAKLVTAVMLF